MHAYVLLFISVSTSFLTSWTSQVMRIVGVQDQDLTHCWLLTWYQFHSILTLQELTTFRRQVYSHYPNVEVWVRYVIVRLCFWWRLWQACFAAHSPKDATSSDLNEQQTLDYYDSVGRSLRCLNKWNGTTKTETAAEEKQMKCTIFMHAGCPEVSSIGSLAPSIRWAPRLVKGRDTQCNRHFSRPRFAAFKMYPLIQRISNVLKRYCHHYLVSGDSSGVQFSQLKMRQVMSFSQCRESIWIPWRKPMFQKVRKGAYFYTFYLETAKVVDGDRKHIPMSSETRPETCQSVKWRKSLLTWGIGKEVSALL